MQSSLDTAPACSVSETIPATIKYFFLFVFFSNQKDTWHHLLRYFATEGCGPDSPAAMAAWIAPGGGKPVALRRCKCTKQGVFIED